MREVDRAFDTVQQRIARLERSSEQAAVRGAQARVKAAQKEAKDREAAASSVSKGMEKSEALATGSALAGSRERTKAAEIEAKRRQKIIDNSAAYAGRYAAQQANAEIREAERATKAIEKEHEKREKIREKKVHGALHATIHGTGERLARLGEMGGAILGIGAGFELADIARERLASQRNAARLSVLGKGALGSSTNEIIGKAGEVGIATGTNKNDLINAAFQFTSAVGPRGFQGGQRNLEFFAKLSKVTGKSVGEIAELGSTMVRENKGITDQEMRAGMLATLSPGAFGRAATGDVAQMVAKFGATRGAFAGNPNDVMKSLMAFGQLSFEQTGTARGATAAMKALTGLKDKKGVSPLGSMGVQFTGGQITSPEQMVMAIMGSQKFNRQKIMDKVGAGAMPLFDPLLETFRTAEGKERGSGVAAVQSRIKAAGAEQFTEEDLDKNFSQVMDTAAEKFDKAVNTVKESIENRLAPFIDRLANKISTMDFGQIEKFIDAVAKMAEWLIDNPWKGIGLAVTLSIVKDIAGAMIGNAIKGALLSALAGGGGGSAAGGAATAAAGGGLGAVGSVAATAAVGLAVGLLPALAYDTYTTSQKKKSGAAAADTFFAANKDNPEALAKAQQAAEEAAAKFDKNKPGFFSASAFKRTGGEGLSAAEREAGSSSEGFAEEMKRLTAALRDNTEATKKSTSGEVAMPKPLPDSPRATAARESNMGARLGGASP